MGRHKKPGFQKMKMLASRIEEDDYFKFEKLVKESGKKSLQEYINWLVVESISGNLYHFEKPCCSGSCGGCHE
jgi:hypothetical protein